MTKAWRIRLQRNSGLLSRAIGWEHILQSYRCLSRFVADTAQERTTLPDRDIHKFMNQPLPWYLNT